MKMIFLRNILIAFCFCCISCGNSSATSKISSGVSKTEVEQIVKSSTDNITIKLDSISKLYDQKIQDISKDLKKQQSEKAKGNRDKWIYISWLSLLTGLMVLLVYCWNKTLEKKDLKKVEYEIDTLKNDLKQILSRHEQDISKKNLIIKDNDSLNIQIRQILERLLVIEDIQKNSSQKGNRVVITEKSSEKSEDSFVKEGYFGIVKGHGIFNDVFHSKQDESKFKVWFKSNGKDADFDLIDLRRVKSFDGIEKAVLFDTTEVSLQEASSYETLQRGLVTKKDDFWDIKQKIKVKLKK